MAISGFDPAEERLTHYLFRYPAKFHPPVVRALLENFTNPGDLILDPFCGSGTLMVEAAVAGRDTIGLDVDPVACLVSKAKTARYDPSRLRASADVVIGRCRRHERPEEEYERRQFRDLGVDEYENALRLVRSSVPAIPNLLHWFRRYVVIDLARIRSAIKAASIPERHRTFLMMIFGSIIRNASNADPVPVSGLEVTAYMKRRDEKGRVVNPFEMFERAVEKALRGVEQFRAAAESSVRPQVIQGDATRLSSYLDGTVDAVITSPPYHGAVDYYRRHQLEMYWLGLTKTHVERLALLEDYIGRPKAPQGHRYVRDGVVRTALAKEWERRIRDVSAERADAFRHYVVGMAAFFEELSRHVERGAPVVMVLGHSTWNSAEIPSTKLFVEIAGDSFEFDEWRWYPVKNRYMSYTRHNNASIDKEYVLVLRKT